MEVGRGGGSVIEWGAMAKVGESNAGGRGSPSKKGLLPKVKWL